MKKALAILIALVAVTSVAVAQVTVELDSSNKIGFYSYTGGKNVADTQGEFSYFSENRFYLKYTSADKNVGVNFTPRFNMTSTNAKQLFHRVEWDAWAKVGTVGMVKFGNFDAYLANRVTGDASSYTVWEMTKLGVNIPAVAQATAEKLGVKNTATDNMAGAGDSNTNAIATLYTGPVTLEFGMRNKSASMLQTEYFENNFGIRASGKIADYAKVNVTFTTPDIAYVAAPAASADDTTRMDTTQLGIYAEFLKIKNTTFVIGYSGIDKLQTVYTPAHAVNLRVNAKFMDSKLSVTDHTDYTIQGDDATWYNMVNVAYKLDDVFMPELYGAIYLNKLDAGLDTYAAMISPRVTISLNKLAKIDFGPEIRFGDGAIAGVDTYAISVPMVFRIQGK